MSSPEISSLIFEDLPVEISGKAYVIDHDCYSIEPVYKPFLVDAIDVVELLSNDEHTMNPYIDDLIVIFIEMKVITAFDDGFYAHLSFER